MSWSVRAVGEKSPVKQATAGQLKKAIQYRQISVEAGLAIQDVIHTVLDEQLPNVKGVMIDGFGHAEKFHLDIESVNLVLAPAIPATDVTAGQVDAPIEVVPGPAANPIGEATSVVLSGVAPVEGPTGIPHDEAHAEAERLLAEGRGEAG